MLSELLISFQNLFAFTPLMYIFIGVFLGCTVGAIPGLTTSMLITLTLPLTYHMTPVNAVTLLVSMYIGGVSGGLVSAILLRIPGTPASVVTTFDGYPMAQKGLAGRAIGLGITSSFIGGLISWVLMIILSPIMAKLALKFSTYENFSLVLMALVLIAALGQGDMLKALISGFLGLVFAVPGLDPIAGTTRLTFKIQQMTGGLSLLPILIGLFGISQILNEVLAIEKEVERIPLSLKGIFLSWKDLKRHSGNFLRSSIIGTWIGVLPGIGADIGSIVAYSSAKNASKHPELFGQGSEEGIVASEAANNATICGALVPLLTLGIPGSVVTAILLGALVLHGLYPGPLLFADAPEVVYGVMATAFVANIVMFFIMIGGSIIFARLIDIPRSLLQPILVVFCVIGSFALNNRVFDVWVMFAFGLLGFFLEKCKVPLGPFIIGVILSPIAEVNLRASMMRNQGSLVPFFTRPISLIFIIIAILSLVITLYKEYFSKKAKAKSSDSSEFDHIAE